MTGTPSVIYITEVRSQLASKIVQTCTILYVGYSVIRCSLQLANALKSGNPENWKGIDLRKSDMSIQVANKTKLNWSFGSLGIEIVANIAYMYNMYIVRGQFTEM